jgi:hypothetical protein
MALRTPTPGARVASPVPDARTTPPRLRMPALVLLLALVAWFGVCYRFALVSLGVAEAPAAVAAWSDLFWLGRWRMFTDTRPEHVDLLAEARVAEAWQSIHLAAFYPSRRDEGPGYLRDDFLEHPKRLEALAAATCARIPGPPERIRFTLVRWPKTLGHVDQPRDGATTREVLDVPCAGARRGEAILR